MKKEMTQHIHTAKSAIFTLLLCASLVCAACGSDTGKTGQPDASADAAGTDAQPSDESAGQSEENADQNEKADQAATENDTSVTSPSSRIQIEPKEETITKTAKDGTVYFEKSYTYPVVTIEGNEAAAERINSDLLSRIASFVADTGVEDEAKEYLDIFETEGYEDEYPLIGYSEGLSFLTQRADSNVISFTMTYNAYTGGAHGIYNTTGVNYDAKTGSLISFSDLSEDAAAFHEDTLAYNQKLAGTDPYKERMFSQESVTDGTLESVLYADDVWYLSTSGLVFMSAPYALGPYAAGTIEFIIPYSDLADMGFKPAYAYTDRLVRKLQSGETYHVDLNGDGEEDSILAYGEHSADENGAYSSLPHLIINDKDFAVDGDDALKKQIAEFFSAWTGYTLYDLNADDSYVELMSVAGEIEGDDYVYYSHFYRYKEDGSLVYLGWARGDANDPTMDTSVLTLSIE